MHKSEGMIFLEDTETKYVVWIDGAFVPRDINYPEIEVKGWYKSGSWETVNALSSAKFYTRKKDAERRASDLNNYRFSTLQVTAEVKKVTLKATIENE